MSETELVLYKLDKHHANNHITKSILFIYILFVIIIDSDGAIWFAEYWTLDNILTNSEHVFFLTIIICWFVYLIYNNLWHGKIILTSSGIYYKSSWPNFLKWMHSDWYIKWSQIKRVYFFRKTTSYLPTNDPSTISIMLETNSVKKEVVPILWFESNIEEKIDYSLEPFTKFQCKNIIQNSPIIKYINNIGIQVLNLEQTLSKDSLYKSNINNKIAFILCFILVIYSSVDYVINQEVYVYDGISPFKFGILAGVVTFLLTMLWLTIAKVPSLDRILVSLAVASSMVYGLANGLLRINQFTDSHGLQTYQYVLQKDLYFKPLQNNELPVLRFTPDIERYWSNFEVGTVHEFELRKGKLGFYQLNEAPIYVDMEQYYLKHN